MHVMRIRPSRQTRYDVELFEKLGDHEVGIVFGGEVVELSDDAEEGGFDVLNGLRGEVFTLTLQATMMFDELFSVELDSPRGGRQGWASGQESLHTVPWPT
jgi:hypothetical protein